MSSQEMYFVSTNKQINLNYFKHIISIGNKCCTALTLRSLQLYKESYPFDWIPTQPDLVLKYILDSTNFLPEKKSILNKDKVWFGHFDIDKKYEETAAKFKRRFERLHQVLSSSDPFLLVYTSEADVYNEMNSFYNDNYKHLLNIQNYILNNNSSSVFKILAIHTNKEYPDTSHINNYTIHVDKKHLSLNLETHVPQTWNPYRSTIKNMFLDIFKK